MTKVTSAEPVENRGARPVLLSTSWFADRDDERKEKKDPGESHGKVER